jgi:hypothetical protein
MRNHGKSFTTHFQNIEIKADDPAQQDVPFVQRIKKVETARQLIRRVERVTPKKLLGAIIR